MLKAGDKARLTRGPLRNREVTLLTEVTEGFWQCSMIIDGVATTFAANEWELEAIDND